MSSAVGTEAAQDRTTQSTVGHRQRLRARFLSEENRSLTEETLTELLLTFAIPQRDVRPLAISLLERFGDLQAVLTADPEMLRQIGGISMQELMIPMAVLRVKARDEGILLIDQITGPTELGEGEEVEFRIHLNRAPGVSLPTDELRVDLEAVVTTTRPTVGESEATTSLPRQVVYVPLQGCDATFRYRFDPINASNEERKEGNLERTLTLTVSYHEGRKSHRKSRTHRFTVRLNAERIIRRVGNLGNILGLTPKSMR